jgi:hypothetical protein
MNPARPSARSLVKVVSIRLADMKRVGRMDGIRAIYRIFRTVRLPAPLESALCIAMNRATFVGNGAR